MLYRFIIKDWRQPTILLVLCFLSIIVHAKDLCFFTQQVINERKYIAVL